MAVLGNCPAAGNFAGTTPWILIDELQRRGGILNGGYATDATHVLRTARPAHYRRCSRANPERFANAPTSPVSRTVQRLRPHREATAQSHHNINTLANIL